MTLTGQRFVYVSGWVPSLIFFVSASILGAVLVYGTRNGASAGPPITFHGFNGVGVVVGFIVFTLAAVTIGPAFGASVLIALLFHELGHVLGHQLIGHSQTRFRLVPPLARAPISDEPFRTQGQELFVALMGPGFSIAPMVLAHMGALLLAQSDPAIARNLQIFAMTCGTFNFISLMPFWPLDGGRCVRIAGGSIWPVFSPAITAFMMAAFAAAAWRTGSWGFLVLAAIGLQSLVRSNTSKYKPLDSDTGVIALAAYAFTLAAHFSGGWHLISHYL